LKFENEKPFCAPDLRRQLPQRPSSRPAFLRRGPT
jgi:hypothetical protein